jgi:hypothetical protein
MDNKETVLREALNKCAERKQFMHDQISIFENRLRRLHEDLRELIAEEAGYKSDLRNNYPHSIF